MAHPAMQGRPAAEMSKWKRFQVRRRTDFSHTTAGTVNGGIADRALRATEYTDTAHGDEHLYRVASQGTTIEEAKANLKEAVELFLGSADPEEIQRRFHGDIFVTRFEASN